MMWWIPLSTFSMSSQRYSFSSSSMFFILTIFSAIWALFSCIRRKISFNLLMKVVASSTVNTVWRPFVLWDTKSLRYLEISFKVVLIASKSYLSFFFSISSISLTYVMMKRALYLSGCSSQAAMQNLMHFIDSFLIMKENGSVKSFSMQILATSSTHSKNETPRFLERTFNIWIELIFVSKTLVFIETVLAPSNPLTLRLMAFLPSPSPWSSPASSASTILKSMSF